VSHGRSRVQGRATVVIGGVGLALVVAVAVLLVALGVHKFVLEVYIRRHTSACPMAEAVCRAERPLSSVALGSQPAASNARIMSGSA